MSVSQRGLLKTMIYLSTGRKRGNRYGRKKITKRYRALRQLGVSHEIAFNCANTRKTIKEHLSLF